MKWGQFFVAAAMAATSSAASADFTVTATQGPSAGGMDRYDIVAVNNGAGTGTFLKALEYVYAGTKAFFEVLDTVGQSGSTDGIPDTVNMASTTRSRLRVSTSLNGSVHFGSPGLGFIQPNPYLNGISYFEGAIAATLDTPAGGTGFEIARFYVANGGGGTLHGRLGGDVGNAVPFSVSFGPARTNPHLPQIAPIGNILGSKQADGSVRFSLNVSVSDEDAGDTLALALSLLGGVNDVVIAGGGTGAQVFDVSGTIIATNYRPGYEMSVVADDGQGGTATQAFRVFVPEPASIMLLGLGLLRRRRE